MAHQGSVDVHPSVSSSQNDLSILSAESYENAPVYRPTKASQTRKSPSSKNSSARVKRSLPVDEDDLGDEDDEARRKRSRGRPRLDTKDETAADRRRTQIRLAQRAYRHRKDTAISSLEQRVKELEDANDSLNKEFNKFYDLICGEGVLNMIPHAAPRLRKIATKFSRLASITCPGNPAASSESDEPAGTVPATRKQSLHDSSDVGGHDSSLNHGSQTSFVADPEARTQASSTLSSSLPGAQHQASTLSYEVVTQPTPSNASFPMYSSTNQTQQQTSASHMAQPVHGLPFFTTLPSPDTYTYQERTFGRRLQRRTLERGLALASMKSPPPERYAAVFGFCLLFESRESILRRLATGLARTQNEDLDTWKVPLYNIGNQGLYSLETNYGGSGTHEGPSMRDAGKSSGSSAFSTFFGPSPDASSDDKIEQRIRMICQNFEGEFFSSEETEHFLHRLGINIPQNADFIEAEVNLGELEEPNSTTSVAANPHTSLTHAQMREASLMTPNSAFGAMMNHHSLANTPTTGWVTDLNTHSNTKGLSFDHNMLATQTMNMGAMFAADHTNSSGSYLPTQDYTHMWAPASNWMKTRITINVSLLIEEMISKSVCLGRTPGVRPKDVIRAVKIAAGLSV